MIKYNHKSLKITAVIALFSAIVLFQFQNCSEVQFASRQGYQSLFNAGSDFERIYTINGSLTEKADILFLVDTSGSMDYEHTQMSNRFANFVAGLGGLDWRVAITTMNKSQTTGMEGSGGQLIPFTHSLYFITNSTTDAELLFSSKIQRPISCNTAEACNDHERGIYSAYVAVKRANPADPMYLDHGFFRPDADLNMVFVTDENERSDGTNLVDQDQPQYLIDYVAASGVAAGFTAHSIVHLPGTDISSCPDTRANQHHDGTKYIELSQLTGGVVGSVCEEDYASQLDIIARSIASTTDTLVLPCAPVLASLVVTAKNPATLTGVTYVLSGDQLVFSKDLPMAEEITVKGTCQ